MAFLSFPAEVNERAARIVAGVVASSIALGIAFDARPVLVILAIGFWLRAGFGPRISPLARLAVKAAIHSAQRQPRCQATEAPTIEQPPERQEGNRPAE